MWVTYKEKLKQFSAKLLEVQKPIRLLETLKWDSKILEAVKKSKYRELPKVDNFYYEALPLGFEPDAKIQELEALILELQKELSPDDSLADILVKNCREYQDLVRLLGARGNAEFYDVSKRLFGSPKDLFYGSKSSVKDLGLHLYNILSNLDESFLAAEEQKNIVAEKAAEELRKRFEKYFHEEIIVNAEDDLLADAVASNKNIKLRKSAQFSKRDIDILEVHEGWVHMGTNINGAEQRIAKWLSKGSPRATATQEGLAILMEIFTFVSHPLRARRINNRVLAIDKAEDGANFLDIVEFYRTEGYSEDECLLGAQRVFRGGVVEGKYPFTKDVAYCKGFVENYNFIRACIQAGKAEMTPFLFVGKVHISDVPTLYHKYKEGIVVPPKLWPHSFKILTHLFS